MISKGLNLSKDIERIMFDTYSSEDLGLFTGKIGIAIFFYKYGNKLNNQLYTDFAGELLDEIYEDIEDSFPVDFNVGLTGIGWGIDYLSYNGFVNGNIDEILFFIDNEVISNFHQKKFDYTFLGPIQYILCRINNSRRSSIKQEFEDILKSVLNDANNNHIVHYINKILNNPETYKREDVLSSIINFEEQNIYGYNESSFIHLGLNHGLTGYLYSKLI